MSRCAPHLYRQAAVRRISTSAALRAEAPDRNPAPTKASTDDLRVRGPRSASRDIGTSFWGAPQRPPPGAFGQQPRRPEEPRFPGQDQQHGQRQYAQRRYPNQPQGQRQHRQTPGPGYSASREPIGARTRSIPTPQQIYNQSGLYTQRHARRDAQFDDIAAQLPEEPAQRGQRDMPESAERSRTTSQSSGEPALDFWAESTPQNTGGSIRAPRSPGIHQMDPSLFSVSDDARPRQSMPPNANRRPSLSGLGTYNPAFPPSRGPRQAGFVSRNGAGRNSGFRPPRPGGGFPQSALANRFAAASGAGNGGPGRPRMTNNFRPPMGGANAQPGTGGDRQAAGASGAARPGKFERNSSRSGKRPPKKGGFERDRTTAAFSLGIQRAEAPLQRTWEGVFGDDSILAPVLEPSDEMTKWIKSKGLSPKEARRESIMLTAGVYTPFAPEKANPASIDRAKNPVELSRAVMDWTIKAHPAFTLQRVDEITKAANRFLQ